MKTKLIKKSVLKERMINLYVEKGPCEEYWKLNKAYEKSFWGYCIIKE